MTFKKTLLAASLAAMSMAAVAQTNDASKDEVEAGVSTDVAATANISVVSNYRFRGIDQTFNQPAVQGGFDVTLPYGFYVGNWNSNVSPNAGFPNGNIEMDVYGGWKYAFNEDWGLDTGLLNYFYPGSKTSVNTGSPEAGGTKGGMVYNLEYYIGANWKTVSLKQFFALTDYFNMTGLNNASTAGSGYTDLTATYDLGNLNDSLATWGLVGHVGYFYMNKNSIANYADWKLGITKDIGGGWSASAAYVQAGTSGNNFYQWATPSGVSTENVGHATGVVSIGKTF